jgi:hypothetical protein
MPVMWLVGLCSAGNVFSARREINLYLLWYVDPLLGNDRDLSSYTTAVTRQQPVNSNRGTVFSVRSLPKCYKQVRLVGQLVRGLLWFCRCELLLLEVCSLVGDTPGTQRKGKFCFGSRYQATTVKI